MKYIPLILALPLAGCASFDALKVERGFDQAMDALGAAAPLAESVCIEAKDPEQCVAAVQAAKLIVAELEALKERAKEIAKAVEEAK